MGKDKKKSQDFLDQSWEKIHPHFNKCGSERILLSWRPEWIFLPWKADQERELLLDKSWEERHLIPHKSWQAIASKCDVNRTSSKNRSVVSYKSGQENLVNKSWLKIWLKICFLTDSVSLSQICLLSQSQLNHMYVSNAKIELVFQWSPSI